MPDKVTVPHIRSMRSKGEKIVCVTAYDATFGSIADESGVDVILVGDSLGNVMLGYQSTVPVTLDQMVHHVSATRAGVKRALFVADMPFGSYGSSVAQAVDSAVALMKAGAEAVKLEGPYTDEICAIMKAGIPVMGHIGMTPQSVNTFGGHRVQGKGDSSERVVQEAQAVAEAGAFAMVLELVPADLAERITSKVACATIGIGAGAGCSGQIQVLHDVLGLTGQSFKHAQVFVEGRQLLRRGLEDYLESVREGRFPGKEHSF
jgi:3-methyl-2-oxobutanoate hydroxymethyltransferase